MANPRITLVAFAPICQTKMPERRYCSDCRRKWLEAPLFANRKNGPQHGRLCTGPRLKIAIDPGAAFPYRLSKQFLVE